jgi:tetratricopeptide (TPR) repeat protein
MRQESERERALELVRELIGGRGAAANPLGASVSERAEACVVAGQIELLRDRVTAAQARFQRALELDPRSAAALVGIGQILLRQDNPADAVARFRNALSAERGNLDATIGVAEASLALGQAGDARQVIEPAVRATPGDGRLHYWLGRSLAATSDQRTLAQQSFREAIRLQPTSLDAYVALAEMLLSMQRNDQADQVLMEARARVPESSAIHRALAHSRLVRGDLAGAEGDLRLALQRDPQDIRAHLALGDVLRRMQRLDDARRALDAVTELDPAFPGLAMARGQLAEARGELPQALQTFREALARDPTNVDLIVRVATTLVSLGNFNDADQMLRSVVADHASNAEAQFVLGRARLGAENFVDAVHHLDRAIELNPSRADYKAYSAEAHRRAGDLMRALQLAEQSIELDPTFPRGYWVRAEIRLHRGDAATALVDINRATQLDPRFWAAYATWADIDDALGRRAEAIRLYRLAIEREGSHGDWQYSFGRLLADAGDQGAARTAFTRARSLGGNATPPASWFVQATRALADIERDRGSRAEAQRLYTEYLRLVPAGSAAYNSAALALSDMLNQ